MNWQTWSIEDWNSALIQKVFFANGRAGTTIKRIDANARFLVSCTDDSSADPEEVKKYFLICFGSSVKKIRDLYKWNSIALQSNGGDFPKIFAPLYLTLMAGSADDNTQEFGQFRTRFKELLSPYVKKADSLLSMEFSDLPFMWKHMAEWSKKRQDTLADCGELILPSIHSNENRIGLSKKLAFPTYKDETNLKAVLEAKQLSENSDFAEVIKAIRYRLSNFSNDFIIEFEFFASCIRSQEFLKAYDSRFWGVVQDISLSSEITKATSKYKFCLQLDISDPFEPTPYIFFDESTKELVSSAFDSLRVQRRDGLNFVGLRNRAYPDLQTIFDCLKIANAEHSKVGRIINAGWATLLPDQFGNLTTDGNYSSNGQVCFIVKNEFLSILKQTLSNLNIRFSTIGTSKVTEGWAGFLCNCINRKDFKSILSVAPSGLTRFIRLGWAPPRVNLYGGAWQGQTLLLSPASNPIATLEGAVSGTFKLINSDGKPITNDFDLKKVESGFQADPTHLLSTGDAAFCEYVLTTQDGSIKKMLVYLTQSLPSMNPQLIRSEDKWLVDGSFGALQPVLKNGLEAKVERNDRSLFLAKNLRPFASQSTSVNFEVTPNFDVEFSEILKWVSEALLLRLETRESLPFAELMQHLEGPSLLAKISPKYLRRLLIDGQWITLLYRKGAPWPSIVATPRLAAIRQVGNDFFIRISGMLTPTNLDAVRNFLIEGESITNKIENYVSLDCLEINLSSYQRTLDVAELLSAQIVSPEELSNPLSALNPYLSKMVNFAPPYQSKNMQKWIRINKTWDDYINTEIDWAAGEIRSLSVESSRKKLYWIRLTRDQYLRTDSLTWSTFVSEISAQRQILEVQSDGSIVWSEYLVGIPSSLARWWLLFEGGRICLSTKFQSVFRNGCFKNYLDFLGIDFDAKEINSSNEMRRQYRDLALKKYLDKKKIRMQIA